MKRRYCTSVCCRFWSARALVLLLLVCGSAGLAKGQNTTGQRTWLEFGGGIMRYGGSMPQTQTKAAFSASLHYEITDQLQVQLAFTASEAGGSDSTLNNAEHMGNDTRSNGYYFRTNINEWTLTPSYDFFNLNDGRRFTPYVLAGIGFYNFKPYQIVEYENDNGALRKQNQAMKQVASFSNWQMNVPVGIGLKYALSSNVRLKLEGKYRFLFNPYLDNYNADNKNDHYYSISLGLTFRLKNVAPFSAGVKRNRRDCNCPPVY